MKHPFGNPPFNISLRFHDLSPTNTLHTGTDFVGRKRAVYAMIDGYVQFVGVDPRFRKRGAGVKIIHPSIDGAWSFEARYWHLQDLRISSGQNVSEGQLLGYTTNHLHFDAKTPDGRFQDPELFLEVRRLGERERELTKWLNDSNIKKDHWKAWCAEWQRTCEKHKIMKPEFKCFSFDDCKEVKHD